MVNGNCQIMINKEKVNLRIIKKTNVSSIVEANIIGDEILF